MERVQFERAKRDELRPLHSFFRKITAFVVCVFLVMMLMPIANNKAKANPAVAVPLVVAACEAAGITVEEFALGMTAIITATTGISLIGAMQDYETNIEIPVGLRHWKTPGWRDWEDMTTDEQLATGCLNNYQYYLLWLQYYCMYYGLFDAGNENPDPDDPEGPKFDQSLVRMIRTLGWTTGGVALANYRYPTNKGSYIFDKNELAVQYQNVITIDGYSFTPKIIDYNVPYNAWFIDNGNQINQIYLWSQVTALDQFNPSVVNINYSGSFLLMSSMNSNNGVLFQGNNYVNGATSVSGTTYRNFTGNDKVASDGGYTLTGYLNALYAGTYVINTPNGTATYSNNHLETELPNSRTINYGQIQGTPNGLAESVPSVPLLNDYLQGVDDGLPEGQSQYIVLPDLAYINEPTYDDFVQVRSDEETTVDPDNPVQPNPNPDTPETPTEEDFEQRFSRIIAQPFEAAFPFCLIEDARQLFLKLDAAAPEPDFTLTLPLSEFDVEGAEEIEIDASPIATIGGMVKVGFNILWTAVLIAFAYKLFLKRGE